MNRVALLIGGAALAMGLTALWHGPLGAGAQFAARAEAAARAQLDRDEMGQVQARLQSDPLTRRIILTGPADAFQRRELARRMTYLPGVDDATWASVPLPAEPRR